MKIKRRQWKDTQKRTVSETIKKGRAATKVHLTRKSVRNAARGKVYYLSPRTRVLMGPAPGGGKKFKRENQLSLELLATRERKRNPARRPHQTKEKKRR